MPELLIKYKTPKVKEALTDFSKYLDFKIIPAPNSKKEKKAKGTPLIVQIEKGLIDVKKIKDGKQKRTSIKEMLDEK